jgi:hypothetical protein
MCDSRPDRFLPVGPFLTAPFGEQVFPGNLDRGAWDVRFNNGGFSDW